MIPQHKSGEFFGFFSIFEKFAGIFGPLIFAGTIAATGSSRNAILSVIGFFAVGAALLALVNVEEGQRAVPAPAGQRPSRTPGPPACTQSRRHVARLPDPRPTCTRGDWRPRPGSSPPDRSARRYDPSLRLSRRTLCAGRRAGAVPPATVTLKPSVSGIGAVGNTATSRRRRRSRDRPSSPPAATAQQPRAKPEAGCNVAT